MVEVLHLPLVDRGPLDLLAGPERLVDHGPGADVLQRGAHEGAALARLHVLELDDLEQVALQLEGHAVLQVVGGDGGMLSSSVDRGGALRRQRVGVLGGEGEGPAPVVGDDHRVLDPDAAVLGKVDAGLDGHDVAGGERSVRRPGHPRVLVDLQADAVAGAVHEGVAPARLVDDGPAGGVDVLGLGARPRPRPDPGGLASRPRRRASAAGSALGSPTMKVRVMSEQ